MKGEKMQRFLAALLVIPLAGTLAAAEYFADAINGNDANDGLTEATAKLSLKEAIALADTGDIVTLLPGDPRCRARRSRSRSRSARRTDAPAAT